MTDEYEELFSNERFDSPKKRVEPKPETEKEVKKVLRSAKHQISEGHIRRSDGENFSAIGYFEKALEKVNLIDEDSKEKRDIHYEAVQYLGICHNIAFHYDQAWDYGTKIIELNGDDYQGYFTRGLAKHGMRLYREAMVEFEKALDRLPKNVDDTDLVNAHYESKSMISSGKEKAEVEMMFRQFEYDIDC